MSNYSFSKAMPPTPKLIRNLVLICVGFGILSGFFHPLIATKVGVSFTQLFGFSLKYFFKGCIWQPFTFLFIPINQADLSFHFLFTLAFDLYLLWFIGCKVHQFFGARTVFRLFFVIPIIATFVTSLIAYLFNFTVPIYGLSFAMIPLVVTFFFNDPKSLFSFMPIQTIQLRWLGLALICLYLLQDLSNLAFAAFAAHLLSFILTYLYLLFFHHLKSPFSFTQKFDDFVISRRSNYPNPISAKITPLYDYDESKPEKMSFSDKMIVKMRNNEKITLLDKVKLHLYSLFGKKD